MADVAALAGVSAATAARVVHNNGYVSQQNRDRVQKALAVTGYRPNLQARSLRLKRSFTLGLMLQSARDNPFFTNVSHAIRTAAMDKGYSMLTVNHGNSAEVEEAGVRQFLEHNVEAVILCHGWRAGNYRPILAAGLPIIEVERHTIPQARQIAIDPLPGMSEAVQALASAGHRRITFVGGLAEPQDGDQGLGAPERARVEAFRASVQLSGLSRRDCPVVLGSYLPAPGTDELPGYAQTMGLFTGKADAPTGIIAGSDVMAAGALQAVHDLRRRVPDDVSLIGYDDSLAQFLSPPLSSIAQPYAEIGAAVVGLLESSDRGDAGNITLPSVRTRLIARTSISAPRGT